MNKITIILMIILFYLNIADTCTSIALLSRTDMIEINPIMGFMFMNGLMTAAIFKLAFSGVMIIAFCEILKKVESREVTIVANIALLASVVFLSVTVANNINLMVR